MMAAFIIREITLSLPGCNTALEDDPVFPRIAGPLHLILKPR